MGYKFVLKNSLYILITLIIVGCQKLFPQPQYIYVYDIILKNETGVNIRVEAYFEKEKLDDITIKNNEKVINHFREFKDEASYGHNTPDSLKQNEKNVFKNVIVKKPKYGRLFIIHGTRDSVAIIFDEKKVIVQKCDKESFLDNCPEITKNLGSMLTLQNQARKQYVKWIKKENVRGPYQITLTKEDYDRALPIVK
jgi:hypothetical protein